MISWDEVARSKRESTELGRYSVHVSVVLSVIVSLATVVILSKQNLTHHYWLDAAALIVPIAVTMCFKKWIALIGVATYVGVLVVVLLAAILFGV